MGSNQSSSQFGDASTAPLVLMRIGGNAIAPITNEDLLATVRLQQHPMRCFRVGNGDWYKVVHNQSQQGLSTFGEPSPSSTAVVRVITAKQLFVGNQPPLLQRVLILPVEQAGLVLPEDDEARSKLVLPKIFAAQPARIHLDVGDIITGENHQLFVVVDVEPRGGGIVDSQATEIFLTGAPVPRADKVRFAPAFGVATDEDRDRFREFLVRQAGELYVRKGDSIQDDMGKYWTVMELMCTRQQTRGTTTEEKTADDLQSQPRGMVLDDRAFVSIGWSPEVRPQTECLHCFRMVTSPFPEFDEFAFACPQCGFLVPNPIFPTWMQADRATASSPAKQLLNRLRNALSDIHGSDVRTLVIGSLIARLPKHLDGTLDWRALDEVAVRVLASRVPTQLNSTSEEVLSRLPISKYVKPSPRPNQSGLEEEEDDESQRDRCEICLEEYVEGVSIRTLPCFHRFHVTCSDNWLALARSCPLCKTDVDLSMPDELLQ